MDKYDLADVFVNALRENKGEPLDALEFMRSKTTDNKLANSALSLLMKDDRVRSEREGKGVPFRLSD